MEEKSFIIKKDLVETLTFTQIIIKYEPLLIKKASGYVGNYFEFDDLYQVALFALWKAFKSYDMKKYKIAFGYYASKIIANELGMYYRKNKRGRKINGKYMYTYSLEDIICTNVEGQTITPLDILEENKNIEDDAIKIIQLKDAINCLTEEEKMIFKYYLVFGITAREISELTGYSLQNVFKKIRNIKKKIKKYYGRE